MPDYTNYFNTQLSPEEEAAFQRWVFSSGIAAGRDLSKDLYDYDLRGYWKSQVAQGGPGGVSGHLSDIGKKPNHPSFSNESMYSNALTPGGSWGNGVFEPGAATTEDGFGAQAQRDYFRQYEPDTTLLPVKGRGR